MDGALTKAVFAAHVCLVGQRRQPWLPEAADITQLNDWIGTLADPAALAAGQDDDGAAAVTAAELRRRIREVEAKLANLVASIEAGIDRTIIAPQMAARTASVTSCSRACASC